MLKSIILYSKKAMSQLPDDKSFRLTSSQADYCLNFQELHLTEHPLQYMVYYHLGDSYAHQGKVLGLISHCKRR